MQYLEGRRYIVQGIFLLVALVFAAFLGANVLFAFLYLAGGDTIGNGVPGSFSTAFFFSAQTLTTVGFGHLHPQGTYASILAALEAFMGVLGFAMASGLAFARLMCTETLRVTTAAPRFLSR